MPTSREQAQRYAEASRRKKRRGAGPRVVLQKETADAVVLEEAASAADPSETTIRTRRVSTLQPRVQRSRPAVRRPFSDYRAEYSYVARDLRRVVIVSTLLLAALIVLYFVLR
jgi:hypothetical protein